MKNIHGPGKKNYKTIAELNEKENLALPQWISCQHCDEYQIVTGLQSHYRFCKTFFYKQAGLHLRNAIDLVNNIQNGDMAEAENGALQIKMAENAGKGEQEMEMTEGNVSYQGLFRAPNDMTIMIMPENADIGMNEHNFKELASCIRLGLYYWHVRLMETTTGLIYCSNT